MEAGGGGEKRKAKHASTSYTKLFRRAKEQCKSRKQFKQKVVHFFEWQKVMDPILHRFTICEDCDYL